MINTYSNKQFQILPLFDRIIMYLCKKKEKKKLKNINLEESLFQQLVARFADFWWNKSTFIQKNHTFKKSSVRKVYISTFSGEKQQMLLIFCKIITYLSKKKINLKKYEH